MQRQRKTKFRPRHDELEPRSLMTLAVLDVANVSSYDITFGFQWTPGSTERYYTLRPDYEEVFSTTYSSSLTPQVTYDTTTSPSSTTTQPLTEGYGEWNGRGNPPASAGTLYEF